MAVLSPKGESLRTPCSGAGPEGPVNITRDPGLGSKDSSQVGKTCVTVILNLVRMLAKIVAHVKNSLIFESGSYMVVMVPDPHTTTNVK